MKRKAEVSIRNENSPVKISKTENHSFKACNVDAKTVQAETKNVEDVSTNKDDWHMLTLQKSLETA